MDNVSVLDRPSGSQRMAKNNNAGRKADDKPADQKAAATQAVSFRVPRELHERLENAARQANMELPQFMRFYVTKQIDAICKVAEKVADAFSDE